MSKNANWKEADGGKKKHIRKAQILIHSTEPQYPISLCTLHYIFLLEYQDNSNVHYTNVVMGIGNALTLSLPLLEKEWMKFIAHYIHWTQNGWHLIAQSIQINNISCASISRYNIPRILNSKLLHRTVLSLSVSLDRLIVFLSFFSCPIFESLLSIVFNLKNHNKPE